MKVSVIILNYNGKALLSELFDRSIESVFKQRTSKHEILEIIFADNNSRDDSVKYFLRRYGLRENVKIVRFSRNYGFARGINYAVRHVDKKADLILILNPDVLLHEYYVETLADAFEKYPSLCCAQGLEIAYLGKNLSYGILVDDTLRSIELVSLNANFNDLYRVSSIDKSYDKQEHLCIIPVDAVIGAAMMTRKVVFDLLKGFPEEHFMYYEEIDFCLRARALGYFSACMPYTWYIHVRGGSTPTTPWIKYVTLYLRRRNRTLTALKFLPNWKKFLKLFMLSLPLEFIQDIRKHDKSSYLLADLWAYTYFLRNFKLLLYLRNRPIYQYSRLKLMKFICKKRTILKTNLSLSAYRNILYERR